jgi:hypothetical protein
VGSGLIDSVANAALCEQPWTHLEIPDFLPADALAELESGWPDVGWQSQRHDGAALRKYQCVEDRFQSLAKALKSAPLEAAFRERLGVYCALYPVAHLVEDAPGYKIRPHTDCAGKVITCQLYLAGSGDDETQGVILQTHGTGGVAKQIPYRRNHGYAFKVTDRSWHRVAQCAGRRRSLQLLYYATPNPAI